MDENLKLIREYLLKLVRTDNDFKKELLSELEPNIKEMVMRYAHLDPQIESMISSAVAASAASAMSI